MYMDGVHIRMRAHDGQNHQKTVRLVGQKTTVFGTSNWSTASDDNQLEVNYFTTKDWFYEFFRNQFEWKWNNKPLDGSSTAQTTEFIPSEPDGPSVRTPANAATGVTPGNVVLKWSGNNWGRKYDIYFGIGPNPPLVKSDLELGAGDNKTFTVSAPLPGTTYSWKIVSKTMANVGKAGGLWTFTTSGTPPTNPPPPQPDTTAPTVYVYSPGNNSTVSGTRDVYASATDNVAAVGVQFKLDGVNLKSEDTSAPFKISWDTTTASNGPHTLTAVARDNAGNRGTTVDVDSRYGRQQRDAASAVRHDESDASPSRRRRMEPPSRGSTTVSATASDNVGVVGVQFKVDGANLGSEDTSSPYSASWTTTSFTNGTHTVTATARDAAGNVATSAPVTVTVSNQGVPTDTTPPTVAISAPANGSTVSGTTTVSATSVGQRRGGRRAVQARWCEPRSRGHRAAVLGVVEHDRDHGRGAHADRGRARRRRQFDDIGAGQCHRLEHGHTAVSRDHRPARGRRAHGEHLRELGQACPTRRRPTTSRWSIRPRPRRKLTRLSRRPKNYVDITFDAPANTAYHLWVRMKAANTNDDSIHVQFSDSVDANGAPIYTWKTTNSAEVVLAEMDGGTISGWGWADQGWNGLGDPIYFASYGPHTLRIQQREDGPRFDQIVLSPDTYFTVAPGPQKNDNTKLPANPVVPPPAPDTTLRRRWPSRPRRMAPPFPARTTVSATSSDNVGVVGVQFKLDGANVGAEDTTRLTRSSWNTTTVSNGAHVLTAVARDAAGNSQTSAPVNVTVSNSTSPPPSGTIVIHAMDVPVANIVGNWAKLSDTSAADGIAMVNTTTPSAKIDPALAAPNELRRHHVRRGAEHGVPPVGAAESGKHAATTRSTCSSRIASMRTALASTGGVRPTQRKSSWQEADGGTISGWGWADQGWNGLGDPIYFANSGSHTLRIQQREDGPATSIRSCSHRTPTSGRAGRRRTTTRSSRSKRESARVPFGARAVDDRASSDPGLLLWRQPGEWNAGHGKWQRFLLVGPGVELRVDDEQPVTDLHRRCRPREQRILEPVDDRPLGEVRRQADGRDLDRRLADDVERAIVEHQAVGAGEVRARGVNRGSPSSSSRSTRNSRPFPICTTMSDRPSAVAAMPLRFAPS